MCAEARWGAAAAPGAACVGSTSRQMHMQPGACAVGLKVSSHSPLRLRGAFLQKSPVLGTTAARHAQACGAGVVAGLGACPPSLAGRAPAAAAPGAAGPALWMVPS